MSLPKMPGSRTPTYRTRQPADIDVQSLPGNMARVFPFLLWGMLVTAIVVASVGWLHHPEGAAGVVVNQYGDEVRLYGRGTYRADSFFRAPVFRGTDAAVLVLAVPALLVAMGYHHRCRSWWARLQLVSLSGSFLYYAFSLAAGTQYNQLFLGYTMLCACALFAFILGMNGMQNGAPGLRPLPMRGIGVFLGVTGVALFSAWLPDIITAMRAGRSLLLIEHYTTEITYVLDMGVVAPACFICLFLLRHRHVMGYVLLDVLLTLCILVGVMLPVQTFFQLEAGIGLPLPVLLTKVGIFSLLALFAGHFKIRLCKAVSA